MKNNKLTEGKEELVRALLLMKYDTSKTLSENKNIVYEQNNQCANTIDSETIKTKAKRIGDLVKYMNTAFIRMGYVDERCKEIYDIINESSKKNFYDEPLSICQNSLKRLKDEFESYYVDYFSGGDTLEEEIQDLIDGDMVKQSPTAKSYLQSSLKILNENIKDVVAEDPCKDSPGTVWDEKTNSCVPIKSGVVPITNTKWKDCPNLPLTKGCKGEKVSKIQDCLGGLSVDGKFGPKTEQGLKDKGYSTTVTQEVYDKIIANCGGSQLPKPEEPTPEDGESIDTLN